MKFGDVVSTTESLGAETVTDIQIEKDQTELAEVMNNLRSEETAIDQDLFSIDDGLQCVDDIDKMQEALDTSAGPASALLASTVESMHSQIVKRLGLIDRHPTLESRGMSRPEMISTLESEKRGILDKILLAMKAVFTTVVNFLEELLQSRKALARVISNLMDKAKDYQGTSTSDVNAGFKGISQVKACIPVLGNMVESVDLVSTFSDQLMTDLKKGRESGSDLVIQNLTTSVMKLHSHLPSSPGSLAYNTYFEFQPLKNTGLLAADAEVKTEWTSPQQAPRLTPDEIQYVLRNAFKALSDLDSLNTSKDRIKRAIGSMKDFATGKFFEAKSHFSSDAEVKAKADREAFFSRMQVFLRRTTSFFLVKVPSIIFKTIKAMADYARASMSPL